MPLRHTRGFRSVVERADHFKAHGARLRIATEDEYEEHADIFLGGPRQATTREFRRSWNSDIVRYDEFADVFGVLGADRFIKTLYCPDPSIHGEVSNLAYYLSEEAKAL